MKPIWHYEIIIFLLCESHTNKMIFMLKQPILQPSFPSVHKKYFIWYSFDIYFQAFLWSDI